MNSTFPKELDSYDCQIHISGFWIHSRTIREELQKRVEVEDSLKLFNIHATYTESHLDLLNLADFKKPNQIFVLNRFGALLGSDRVYNNLIRKTGSHPAFLYNLDTKEVAELMNSTPKTNHKNYIIIETEYLKNQLIDEIIKLLFLYKNKKNPNKLTLVEYDLEVINTSLLKHLTRKPELLYQLNPRKFEELVANLFENEGYSIELTPNGADGGKDIYAFKKEGLNNSLLAVECKRFAPGNKVGRPIVQKLYGVVEQEKLSGGAIVTSSFFTRPAKDFSNELRNRIFLKDYHDLLELISKHKIIKT